MMRPRLVMIALLLSACRVLYADVRQTLLFNDAWRFHRGDVSGAMKPGFFDEPWDMVDLPHDWRMIPDSLGVVDEQADTVGWYRKTFTIRPDETGKRSLLCFERIHGRTDIWVNGRPVYHSPHSYLPIRIDVTPYLNAPWKNNTVAVRVSGRPWSGTDYRGAGITHDTWLVKAEDIRLDAWETRMQTARVYARRNRWYADLELSAMVRNTGAATDGNMAVTVTDPEGEEVFSGLYPVHLKDSTVFAARFTIAKPRHWTYDTPSMYKATLRVVTAEGVPYTQQIPFGISTVEYTPYMGLVCNDESPLLQGLTLDYNGRLTGYTAFLRAEAQLVEHLQFNGCSAVRCPMGLLSEHFLTACDTLGVMVLVDAFKPICPDEEWSARETVDNVKRFRNHPSIVMWCVDDTISQRQMIASVDDSRPIAVTGLLGDSFWSDMRKPLGDRTPLACRLDAERLITPITMSISARDTTRTDSVVWLPDEQRWRWPGYEGDTMKVTVCCNNKWVHLYLNDSFVGNARPDKQTHLATYYVPYVPGELHVSTTIDTRRLWEPKNPKSKIKYIGYFERRFSLYTDATPKRISLSADRKETSWTNGELCFVKIEVQGTDGNILPDAELPLTLHVSGPGLIVAAGNNKGVSSSLHKVTTSQGSAMVIIRPFKGTGTIRLTVYPEELPIEDVEIKIAE